MNKIRHRTTLLTKSYSLCLIFALVGCASATTPRSTLINTQADTLTELTSPSLSAGIPIEITQGNEIRHGLLVAECERLSSSMFDSARPPAVERTEQIDGSFPVANHPNQLQHDALNTRLYEFPATVKIEPSIVTGNNLPNEQSLLADPHCLVDHLRNSVFGPSSLQNSGGGGGGGRRGITQEKL